MLKNENMYKVVHFLRFGENAVLTGRLVSTEISENGFIMHTVLSGDQYYSLDNAIVFDDLNEAQEALKEWKPINDEIIRIMDDSNAAIDRLREEINGKPHFPEYAEMFKAKKKG